MDVILHRAGDGWDVAAFSAAAWPLYAADPVRHTLALTGLDRLRAGSEDPALLVTVRRGGEVVGAALRGGSYGVMVSALPPALAAPVVRRAVAVDPDQRRVVGPVAEARAYAAAHAALTGGGTEVAMRQRLFRLVTLRRPAGVPGACRVGGPDDVDLLAGWQDAFADEVARALGPHPDARPGIVEAMRRGSGFVVWEHDGRPVAYAGARRPVAGMSRVGPVYTPPEHRGRGFGSAVTAAATAWAQEAGAREVCLFTDLANPVSNAIYPRIGYRPLHDALDLRFTTEG